MIENEGLKPLEDAIEKSSQEQPRKTKATPLTPEQIEIAHKKLEEMIAQETRQMRESEQTIEDAFDNETPDVEAIKSAQNMDELYDALEGKFAGPINLKNDVYNEVFKANEEVKSYLYWLRTGEEARGQGHLQKARSILKDARYAGGRKFPGSEILNQKVLDLFEKDLAEKK